MLHKIFTIHDSKAGAYLPPFILPREEMARRTFGDCINSPDHQFGNHPDDYTLFCLGVFDDEIAQYQLDTPKSLGNGLEYVRTDSLNQATEGLSDAEKANGQAPALSNEPPIQSGT